MEEFLVAGDDGLPPGTFDALIKEQIASTWAESVNVAEQLGLARTVEIEILEEVVSRLTTDDPQGIEQIVAALDREYGFVTRGCFNTQFELQFRLDDGTVQILGFGSEGDNPTVLRGHPLTLTR